MKLMNALIRITTIVVVICTFLSCDDDFNSVGSEVIGGINFEDRQYIARPVAYSKKFDRVQTGNLTYTQNTQPINHARLLGVYNDPVYGQTTYGILSQLIPNQFNPQFGNNPVLDSVVVSIPYISTRTETRQVDVTLTQPDGTTVDVTENETVYTLDSIYQSNPFKLSIYQSNYFLRDFDPATNDRQIYYSNDIESFGAAVEGTLLYSNDNFVPSASEVITTVPDDGGSDDNTAPDRTRIPPQLRVAFKDDPTVAGNPGKVVLDSFKAQFLDKEDGIELSNQDNFNNFFRGIYLKAEAVSDSGNLLYLNSQGITFTLHYTNDGANDSDGNPTRDEEVLTLTFGGTIVNDIRTDFEPIIAEELKSENQDKVNGEEKLYLKGGDGSYAVLDLFNKYVETDADGDFVLDQDGGPVFIDNPTDAQKVKTELDFLRSRDWLINDASFKFYIDQDALNINDPELEPERIYIFNLETGAIIADYTLDVTFRLVDFNTPLNSIPNHLGRITRDSDDAGDFYRIRITQHIINLLNDNDLDNIKFGVCISQNVNAVTSVVGDTATNIDEIIPTSSIVSHEGTILFGNGAGVPEAKSLKLDIFYTESKN
ncbi:DUF4270 domain-containing protein [Aquimarina aggregata]|uniref:DUF4270 domain-containing protein n=1 Tax=Aquimarina aggregata TaxID=1642818 RepID=UPI0024915582|nr:DUF4270 domain-containing protein [Aquimarina aggregata]